jgi:molybdopterin-containing oxidoreductase family iron-sulfur binding subunit
MSEKENGVSRRGFLAISAATLGGIALAPGIRLIEIASAKPAGEAVTSKVRWGMLIDSTRCATGCTDCVSACGKENGLHSTGHPRSDAQWIRKIDLKDLKSGRAVSLPMMCQHCANPPCVDVCPTGASFKRADGIVLVDRHTCIGCRYCVMACPYKARSFVHEEHTDQNPDVPRGKGCVEGCTLCVHRIDRDQKPACVEACTAAGHNAMIFGDLNDPNSELAKRIKEVATTQVRADLQLDPGVRYQGI